MKIKKRIPEHIRNEKEGKFFNTPLLDTFSVILTKRTKHLLNNLEVENHKVDSSVIPNLEW